jgi:ABC-type Fe3+-hydroxamate transport system substrate-binding protein
MTRRITLALSAALLSTACNDAAPTAVAPVPSAPSVATERLAPAAMRPAKFNVVTRIVAIGTSADGRTRIPVPVVGASVRLLLLPLRAGDRVAPNAERYLTPDSVGVVVTDSSGLVGFYNIDVTRFRIEVRPPAGTALGAGSQEYAPPSGGTLHYEVSLRKGYGAVR